VYNYLTNQKVDHVSLTLIKLLAVYLCTKSIMATNLTLLLKVKKVQQWFICLPPHVLTADMAYTYGILPLI